MEHSFKVVTTPNGQLSEACAKKTAETQSSMVSPEGGAEGISEFRNQIEGDHKEGVKQTWPTCDGEIY